MFPHFPRTLKEVVDAQSLSEKKLFTYGSAQVHMLMIAMVVINGIAQSHYHPILDKTKSLLVALWLLLHTIVIDLVKWS